MGTFPLALSVHHFIDSVGADAGFAAIIGLAILILLYFAQARETATLRDHAYEAADRIQQLEGRVAQLTRGTSTEPPAEAAPAAQPARAPAPVSTPAPARAPANDPVPRPAPVAPAGVGAPALAAATRLIPTAAPAGAVALAPEAPGDSATVQSEPPITARDERSTPRPATVAGAANGASREQSRAAGATAAPPPRVQVRPGGSPPARRPSPPPRPRQPGGEGPNRLLIGGLVVAAIVAVVVLLVILTSGGSGSTKTHTTSNTNAQSSRRAHKTVVNPSTVTVAVLNGTSTPGLAGSIATKLSDMGYKQGTVATASDQTATTTTVAYLPGFRRDALSVATSLKVGAGSVQPIQQAAQAVACPPPAACPANVVVTVGSDLASTQ
jgi:hypothetical protein